MKKLMRILGVVVLSIIMTVAMVACGGGGNSGTSADTDSSTATDTDSDISYTADPEGDTDLAFDFKAGAKTNKSWWNFAYGDTALSVTARVNDTTSIKSEDVTSTDGVYLYVGKVVSTTDYVVNQTLKVFVSADGTLVQNLASSTTEFENTAEGVLATSEDWSRKGTALDGYKVVITVPYASMGLSTDEAVNNLAVLPMVADKYLKPVPPIVGTAETYRCNAEKQNTFITLKGDNQFEANPYGQTGTFGDTTTDISMKNWDISEDYYEGDERYSQRKATLQTATNGTNNELYFYKVNNTIMYAESDFRALQVQNGEKYGKFGIAVVYNGTGFFFHIDAASPDNTGVVGAGSITGKNVGIVEVKNGTPDWSTHQVVNINYNPNLTVQLGVYREEEAFKFFANGNEVFSKSKPELASAEFYMAIWSYNIALELTNFRATADQNDPMIKNNKFETTEVDYLFTGDSYVDSAFWKAWETDMAALDGTKANIGVGGTKVRDWMSRIGSDTKRYKAKNIIMHIGVNDIDDANYTPETFAENFENYIESYLEYDANVKFYWITINPNLMFPAKQEMYVEANRLVKEYAKDKDYLTVIDFYSDTTTIDQTKLADTLHLSKLGYAEWTKAILGAFDIVLDEGDHMGSNEGYVMSAGWDASADNGETPYVVNTGVEEQAIWYKATPVENFYFEAKLTKQNVYKDDKYPKMGIVAKTAIGEVFYYIDAVDGSMQVGSVSRMSNGGRTSDWAWNLEKKATVGNFVYTNGTYATLGLLKYGHTFYLFANGAQMLKLGYEDTDGAAQVGLMAFNLGLTAKDFKYVTDETELNKIAGGSLEDIDIKLADTTGTTITRENFEENSAYTEENDEIIGNVLNENHLYSKISSENFYFEVNFTLTKVNNNDQYPKAGIVVKGTSNSTLLFYMDATSNGSIFNDNRVVGITQKSDKTPNSDWVWGYTPQNGSYVFNPFMSAPNAAYLNGKYARMAIAKYNGTYYFVVNNVVYFIHDGYYGAADEATPGIGGFNVDMKVNKVVATTEDSEILENLKLFNIATESGLIVDGDISDWEANETLSAHYYETVATDNSGKSIRFYAAKVDGGVMVAGKAVTANNISVNSTEQWWVDTNVEWTYGAASREQNYASVLRDLGSAKAFNFKSKALDNNLYEITFEMFISYDDMPYNETQDVEIMLAFRNEDTAAGMCEGSANLWWCGAYHIYNASVCPYVITENGISWKEGYTVTGA